MSSLFIRLYLDEDVNVLIADLLKAKGFDVLTVRDAGNFRQVMMTNLPMQLISKEH